MKTLLFALGTAALVGCHSLKPSGPLASDAPKSAATAKSDLTPPPALKPTPPTMLVDPGAVTSATAHDAADKLTAELSADSKPSVNAPVTVEVSHIKGRSK